MEPRSSRLLIQRRHPSGRLETGAPVCFALGNTNDSTKKCREGYHTSAVSLVVAKGRIWRPFEVAPREGKWRNFEAVVFSAPVDADLLDAKSWTTSTRMAVDTAWGKEYGTWLEGGAVLSRNGHLLNILRVNNLEEEVCSYHSCIGRREKPFLSS